MRTLLSALASRSNLARPAIVAGLGSLLAAAALAQVGTGAPLPALAASNDCTSGDCARQMLAIRQFDTWQQQVMANALQRMPWTTAAAGSTSKPSTSCSWHEHGANQWTLICLSITAQGSCACVITSSGGSCLGSNPYCPAKI